MNENRVPENRAYKVTLILLMGLAAFSTAMKDLNRLQVVTSVRGFASQWRGTDVVMLNMEPSMTSESCPNDGSQLINYSSELDSNYVGPASGIEIEIIDRQTVVDPEVGGQVELIASTKPNRNVPHLTRAKHAPVRNLQEEIFVMRRDDHWPARLEYKTFDRSVTLNLPISMVTDIKADALETEISRDFPLSLLGKINRKQSHGRTEISRRDFMFKKFERNNSLRPAG
ncbi:hypothetical protein BH18ACI4_BH18ACI4_04830 [soil metagenome]